MLPPTGADETRGRHLGVVIRSTQCNPFAWSNKPSAHSNNHTSLNTTDFHAFFCHTCSYDKGHMVWRVLLFNTNYTNSTVMLNLACEK